MGRKARERPSRRGLRLKLEESLFMNFVSLFFFPHIFAFFFMQLRREVWMMLIETIAPETSKSFPAELPTPYNIHSGGSNPAASPGPSFTAGGYRSPVSPATPGEERSNIDEAEAGSGRPTHGRHMSTVSSAPSASIADVISEDEERNVKGHAMRPSIVSNVSEMSSTPSSFSEQGTWAGLGINPEGKLSPTREDKE